MVKRTTAFVLSIMLVLNSVLLVKAQEEERYGTLSVEYSDAVGQVEPLNVLVKDGYLYAEATQLGERLGYEVVDVDDGVVIMNRNRDGTLSYSFTQFSYSSKKVVHLIYMQLSDSYQAPCVSIKNEKGIWIPLEFSLLMLNSSLLIVEETVLIGMPERTIVDTLLEISLNCEEIGFDLGSDFGYTDSDILLQEAASRIINQFNGLLKKDETAWASTFAWAVAPELGYDAKYGEDFATLMCTNSRDELSEAIKKIKEVNDYLAEDGKLGVFLGKIDKRLDDDLGNWEEVCDTLLEGVEDGTGRVSTLNRAYHKLEKAFNRQSSFVHTAGTIQRVQKGFSEATRGFSKLVEVGRLVNYGTEFGDQDRYSMAALKKYIAKFAEKTMVPQEMMKGIRAYLSLLESDVVTFSTSQYIKENWMDLVDSALDLGTVMKQQAAWQLIVWDLTSEYVPFVKNGLSAADKFELSLYGFVFQADALTNYLDLTNTVFRTEENITAENIYELTQIGYVYLKSAYITRTAAVASLRAKSDSIYKQIQPLIDRENRINEKIGGYMAELKTAEKTNKGCIYGFLPKDNVEYLKGYSDEKLIKLVLYWENEMPVSIVGTWVVDGIKTNSENNESLRHMFGSSIKYGSGMQIEADGTFGWGIAAGWGGDGIYVVNENNIICNYIQDGYEECFEMRLLKENDKEYLIMDMTTLFSDSEYYLYWIRDIDGNTSEYKNDSFDTHDSLSDQNHVGSLKPTEVRWSNARAKWKLEYGTQGYEMEVYKDQEFFMGSKYIGVTREKMVTTLCPDINESGEYAFRVRMLNDQGNAVGEWSEWSDIFKYIRPKQELGTVSNVRWSADKGIEWDPPSEIPSTYQNRIRYNLVIYKNGKKIKIYTNLVEPILSVEEWRGDDGDYEISIQAVSEDIILTANGKIIMSNVQLK